MFLTLTHMVASGLMPAGMALLVGGARGPTPSAQQLRRLAALAAVFSSSVVLGNVALRFIPVSFFQVLRWLLAMLTSMPYAVSLRRQSNPNLRCLCWRIHCLWCCE